jgi:molybdopterin-containing oxidoreductase family iron-sulfur binding subunit
VACPTTARIFGDLDDPKSKLRMYIKEQQDETDRDPFCLLPEAGTKPSGRYLGPMASQGVSTLGQPAEPEVFEEVAP